MTQAQKVKDILHSEGKITRNRCLGMYISRLSAIIQDLEGEGYEFETKHEGTDYAYYLKDKPKKRIMKKELDEQGNIIRVYEAYE